jgi:hypothetical protein
MGDDVPPPPVMIIEEEDAVVVASLYQDLHYHFAVPDDPVDPTGDF